MDASEHQHVEPEVASVASAISLPKNTLFLVSAAVALIVVIATALFRRRSVTRGSTVLLLGASDAGKTAIFSALSYSSALPSHASLQPNVALISPASEPSKSPPLRIVDVPGHPRIRAQFAEFMPDARAIAFVVDASTIARNGPVVAEHLHTVLHAITSLPPSQKTPELLIYANKSDLLSSRAPANPTANVNLAIDRVRTILERELEKRRQSSIRGVGVEGLGAEGEEATMGGLECSGTTDSFKFENWDGGMITLGGGWVDVKRGDGIESSEKVLAADGEKTNAGVDGLAWIREWLESP